MLWGGQKPLVHSGDSFLVLLHGTLVFLLLEEKHFAKGDHGLVVDFVNEELHEALLQGLGDRHFSQLLDVVTTVTHFRVQFRMSVGRFHGDLSSALLGVGVVLLMANLIMQIIIQCFSKVMFWQFFQ